MRQEVLTTFITDFTGICPYITLISQMRTYNLISSMDTCLKKILVCITFHTRVVADLKKLLGQNPSSSFNLTTNPLVRPLQDLCRLLLSMTHLSLDLWDRPGPW